MPLPLALALEIASGNFLNSEVYKCSLYTAPLNDTSAQNFTSASAAGETTGTGYTAGGFTLAPGSPPDYWRLSATTAVYDPFDVVSNPGSTFTFISLLVYAPSAARVNNGLYFFNAGTDQVVNNGTLTIVWPVADSVTGLVRVPQ